MYLSVKIKEAMKNLIDLITPKLENKKVENIKETIKETKEELKSEDVVAKKELVDAPVKEAPAAAKPDEGINVEEAVMELINVVNELNKRMTAIEEGLKTSASKEDVSALSKDIEDLNKNKSFYDKIQKPIITAEEKRKAEIREKMKFM